MNKYIICLFMSVSFLLGACAPSDPLYEKSMSVKEFLFDTNYTLQIDDGEMITRYSSITNLECGKESIMRVYENDILIAETLIVNNGKWVQIKNTDIIFKFFYSS